MKKSWKYLLALPLALAACKEESLLEDNPPPPGDNVAMTFVPFYGDDGLDFDSVYRNQAGQRFYIDSVTLLVSDFQFFTTTGDTIGRETKDMQIFRTGEDEKLIGQLTPGGYSGKFMLTFGMDSSNMVSGLETVISRYPSLWRRQLFGWNWLEIKGRLFDPADPSDTIGKIPIAYRLGGFEMGDSAESETRTFSVNFSRPIKLITTADLKPLLHNLNLSVFREVNSNPTDNLDIQVAKAMRDSLRINIF